MDKKSKKGEQKSKPTKLKVTCTDGKIIQCQFAWQTLAMVIKKIGVEKVMQMGRSNRREPLISTELFQDKAKSEFQKDLGNGYYLYTKSSTNDKCVTLEEIRKDLKVDWIASVEVVKN